MIKKLEEVMPDFLYKYKEVLIRKIDDTYIFTISGGTFKFQDINIVIGIIDELTKEEK